MSLEATQYLAYFFCLAWLFWGIVMTSEFIDSFAGETLFKRDYLVLVVGILLTMTFGIFDRIDQSSRGALVYWRDLSGVRVAAFLGEFLFYIVGAASGIFLVLGWG